jgi:ABC-type Mn2+/Zn2+ transport system permease subunit
MPEADMGTGEIITTIVKEFPYAFYGSILVGILCAYLGVYIVSKRVVFLGAALTQISVLGLTLTFLPFLGFMGHTISMVLITALSVMILARLLTGKKLPKDAILGIAFITSIAARILIMQKAPKVETAEVENLLRGDILFVTPEIFYLLLCVFITAMAIHIIFFKEFTFISFDSETARTQGFRSGFWDTLFYLSAALVISVATHMVGDVFVFGFLVIPPVIAMLLARRVRSIFICSTLIGAVIPAIGLFLAFKFDFPSSPAIVGVAGVLLGIVWLFSLIRRTAT